MQVVITAVTLAIFVLVVGALCSRLLGVRIGRWRGALVGAGGWCFGLLATYFTLGRPNADGSRTVPHDNAADHWTAIAVLTCFGVLAAMPLAIAADVLTRRSGERRHRSWRDRLHPVRALRRRLAPYSRLREIAGYARRDNLLHLRYASRAALASPDFAVRLRQVIEDSGGILVKFGQIASTRTDVLPDALTAELSGLRSDARPVAADDVRSVVEAELGVRVEEAFSTFDWQPLAAASIGQTHRAVLPTGEHVIVKVQRPGIADIVERDASMLRLAARQLEHRAEAARTLGVATLCDELIRGVQAELDYRDEAAMGMRLRELRRDDVGIAVPAVYPTLSTRRVLVMEEIDGQSIDTPSALAASPVPPPELARRLLSSFLGQVLVDGVFHADPHPGNLFLDAAGTVWLLDFGSVGRLDPLAMHCLRQMALGIAARDTSILVRAVRDLSGNDGSTDLRALEADLATVLTSARGGIDPALIASLLTVMDRHGLRPPPSVTLLGRALITLEGSLGILDPTFEIATTSSELVSEQGDEAFGTPQEMLQRELLRQLPSLRTLPEHAETLANQLRSGRLTVRTERFATGDRDVVDNWVDRLVVTIIGSAGAVTSAGLLLAASVTPDHDLGIALRWLGFGGLAGATVLLMRSAARALRRLPLRID